MLLDGGLKWQSMALSPADMDFAELKQAAARDIALAFGVPPMLLGLPGDNTSSNYREARSDERRVGNESVGTCSCRRSPYISNIKYTQHNRVKNKQKDARS